MYHTRTKIRVTMKPNNTHVIALLRQRMIPPLSQKEFAKEFGVSGALIQGIELGPKRKKLSDQLARKISDQWDVDLDQLLLNSINEELRRQNGQPWTPEAVESRRRKLEWIGALKLEQVENSLVPLQIIVGQVAYLQEFFQNGILLNNYQAREQWTKLFHLATAALSRLQNCDDWHQQNYPMPEQLVKDIRRMEKVTDGWAKEMKRMSELPELDQQRELSRFCIRRFPKERREAYDLIKEMGIPSALVMGCGEFCTKLALRTKKENPLPVPPETRMSEIFAAIEEVYREHEKKVKEYLNL